MRPLPANNIPVGDLLSQIERKELIIKPDFQRRLVWTNADKEKLIQTVLQGFPFPEVFTATGERRQGAAGREQWLVDGQQRLSTLRDYYLGSEELVFREIPRFSELEPNQQDEFLDYFVVVRDLGIRSVIELREIFRRINSTNYALTAMEKLNAVYAGSYKVFCEHLAKHDFFVKHKVFNTADMKRMYDTSFCVILVSTMLGGYYHRDDRNEEFLKRYNDVFEGGLVLGGLETTFKFLERCRLGKDSRAWKKTDLLTLIVEVHSLMVSRKAKLDHTTIGNRLRDFYDKVDALYSSKADSEGVESEGNDVFAYMKAATKATNDKYTRVLRAGIIGGILSQEDSGEATAPSTKTTGKKKSKDV